MVHSEVTETPAARAIRLLGAKRIAAKRDLTTNAVWKWASQGDGLIPAQHQAGVFELARELGVDLTAEQIIGVAA